MDGWGLGKDASSDAIRNAKVPFVSSLYQQYPNTTLVTYGEEVGLPEGQMGNSEVGHLNLGAGRIVNQELQRINVAVRDGSFGRNPTLLAAIRGPTCGVAFDQQIVRHIPVEPHDMRLSFILTPTRWQCETGPRAVLK